MGDILMAVLVVGSFFCTAMLFGVALAYIVFEVKDDYKDDSRSRN